LRIGKIREDVNGITGLCQLTIILKKYPGKIGARTETKVDNRKDYNSKANSVDHFMAEVFFPMGRSDEMLKSLDWAPFQCKSIRNRSGLSDLF
jgi:hypothetical protein